MTVRQKDIVLRAIEQIAAMLRAVVLGERPAAADTLRHEIEEATSALLGPMEPFARSLDAESAANLLHDPERIFAYAQLLALEAALEDSSGDVSQAELFRSRAMGLARAAEARVSSPRPEWSAWLKDWSEGEGGGGGGG